MTVDKDPLPAVGDSREGSAADEAGPPRFDSDAESPEGGAPIEEGRQPDGRSTAAPPAAPEPPGGAGEAGASVPAEADDTRGAEVRAASAETSDGASQAPRVGSIGDEADTAASPESGMGESDQSASRPSDAGSDSAPRDPSPEAHASESHEPAAGTRASVPGEPGSESRGEEVESHAAQPEQAALLTGSPPASEPPPPDDGPTAPRNPERRGGVLPLVISLVALLGLGALGWQVYELRLASRETRQEVAQRLVAGDTGVAEIRALTRQQHESIAALQNRFGALESQVAASEGQAAALELMYLEHSRSRADQILSEVEQAINIAAQQLHLAGNFEAALIALQSAEARLNQPEVAHLQPLRRALIKDIDELKAHPQVDVSGLALRLEILLDRVDGLPLAFEVALERAAAANEKLAADRENGEAGAFELSLAYGRALASDIWNEIKGMVRLERLDHADPVLLSPEQSTYLRENVKIRLLTARLALLARDGRTYATDLGQARGWIERYFDTRNEQVQRVIADLTELEQTPVKAEQPSLAETFAALRLLQARSSGVRPSRPGAGNGAGSEAADGSR